MSPIIYTPSGADLSDDGLYRFDLWRIWDPTLPELLILGINPSTADAQKNDPTIRRGIGFAKGFGCGGLRMQNVSPLRATDPKVLAHAVLYHRDHGGIDPFPQRGIRALDGVLSRAAYVVCAFGEFSFARGDARHILTGHAESMVSQVRAAGKTTYCLGTTQAGWPRHPLYVRADTPLLEWRAPRS